VIAFARDAVITVLDFETTGAVPGWPVEPWQLGLVQIRQGHIEASSAWESLLRVDAGRPFNPRAPGRHASIRDGLAVAPTLADRWPELTPLFVGPALAAHNIGTERTLLTKQAPLHKLGPWIDTLALVRGAFPHLPSKALDDIIATLKLSERVATFCPGRAPHDALYDAFACAVLLEWLLALPGWETVTLEAITSNKKQRR
jgi:DNA polymerase III epsilon subunit-like protein